MKTISRVNLHNSVRFLAGMSLYFLFSNISTAEEMEAKQVPELTASVCVGEGVGQNRELAKIRAQEPTLYVFIQNEYWDRPIARLLRELDTQMNQNVTGGHIIAVWLSDRELDRLKEHLPRVQQSIKLATTTYAVWPGDAFGPADWNLNRDDHITVISARDGKILDRHAFRSTNEGDAPKIMKAFQNATK
ncbi:MAG: hypothetical protein RJA81_667 [Planctomycetota bacterium]